MNPGIKNVVRWLNENGYRTCDSGDGETHDYECDRDEPYVVICVDSKELVSQTERLLELLEKHGIKVWPVCEGPTYIEATFDPSARNKLNGFIILHGLDDDLLENGALRNPLEKAWYKRQLEELKKMGIPIIE